MEISHIIDRLEEQCCQFYGELDFRFFPEIRELERKNEKKIGSNGASALALSVNKSS